jgi:hypothetical protein
MGSEMFQNPHSNGFKPNFPYYFQIAITVDMPYKIRHFFSYISAVVLGILPATCLMNGCHEQLNKSYQ